MTIHDPLAVAVMEIARLREFLERIEKGEGRYSRDHMTHAENTIDDMKQLAVRALAGDQLDPP